MLSADGSLRIHASRDDCEIINRFRPSVSIQRVNYLPLNYSVLKRSFIAHTFKKYFCYLKRSDMKLNFKSVHKILLVTSVHSQTIFFKIKNIDRHIKLKFLHWRLTKKIENRKCGTQSGEF